MKKLMGVAFITVAAVCGLYFMYLLAAPIAQGFLGCLKILGI